MKIWGNELVHVLTSIWAWLGWRDLVLSAAALISVYLAVSVLRLFQRPTRQRVDESEWAPSSADVANSDYAAIEARLISVAAQASADELSERVAKSVPESTAPSSVEAATDQPTPGGFRFLRKLFRRDDVAANEINPPAGESVSEYSAAAPGFPSEELARPLIYERADSHAATEETALQTELHRLREEAAVLRDELSRLSDEVIQLKSARNVSPIYSEAMSLAERGMEPVGIADRCGISIGEAELVAALTSSQNAAQRANLSSAQFNPQKIKQAPEKNTEEDRNGYYTARAGRTTR